MKGTGIRPCPSLDVMGIPQLADIKEWVLISWFKRKCMGLSLWGRGGEPVTGSELELERFEVEHSRAPGRRAVAAKRRQIR